MKLKELRQAIKHLDNDLELGDYLYVTTLATHGERETLKYNREHPGCANFYCENDDHWGPHNATCVCCHCHKAYPLHPCKC